MKTNAKDQVLQVISKNPGCDTKTITEKVDYGVDTVRKACKSLVEDGKVTRNEVKVGSVRKFLFNSKEATRESLVKKAKETAKATSEERNKKAPKNRDRVAFQGEEYGKAKLVRAIVIAFVAANPEATFEEIDKKMNFDKEGRKVYPKYDVVRPITDELVKKSIEGKYKRYYVNQIQTAGCGTKFAICREWGLDNIDKDFITPIANEQLGYTVDTFKK
jgi:predicted transcriptional regulator